MEIVREEVEQAVPRWLVALLDRIDDHDEAIRLQHARHLGQRLLADRLGQLVHQERRHDEVEARILERQLLGRALDQFYARGPADQPARLGEIGRAEIEAGELHAGPGVVQEGEQAAGAAADIEAREMALVAARHPVGDRFQRTTAHDVGGAGEQHLDLGVVDRGGMLAEPAVALEVEVLAIVVGQPIALLAGRQLFALAVAARIDLRQVAEIKNAAAQEFAGVEGQRPRRRKEPRLDVLPFALEDGAHVLRHLVARGRRPDREVGLGHRLQEPPAGGIVAGIPGDARGLARGIGETI